MPSGKKEYVIQLKAGEELVHRAVHTAVGQVFLTFGELVTLAFLLCDFGQKVGGRGCAFSMNTAVSHPGELLQVLLICTDLCVQVTAAPISLLPVVLAEHSFTPTEKGTYCVRAHSLASLLLTRSVNSLSTVSLVTPTLCTEYQIISTQ